MPWRLHSHGEGCDCAAQCPTTEPRESSGLASALVALLACAVCPPCLTTYAKVVSVLGVGFSLSEFHHLVLLVFAITASVGLSAWRSWRTRRIWPLAIATTGSAMIVAGHAAGDLHAVEWAGVLLLLAGGLTEHFRLRPTRRQVPRTAA